MSQQASPAQKTSMNSSSGIKSSSKDSQIKLPEKKNIRTIFEPASKVAVLGYN
jgi:hypothetical protein